MSKQTVEQVRLTHRGRSFHFVSYEGHPGSLKRSEPATDPAWFLMSAGTRWQVMPHHAGQEPGERDRLLTAWLDGHVFAPTA